MKLTQRLVTYLSLFFVFVSCLWILQIDPSWAYTYESEMQTTSNLGDLKACKKVIPYYPCNKELPKYFYDFAWKTFVGLNWPAECKDEFVGKDVKIKEKGKAPVWEFYSYPKEVFLANGQKPKDKKTSFYPPQCLNKDDDATLLEHLKNMPKLRLSTGISINNSRGKPTYIGDMRPLIDRNGNYIMNEERINPIEVNQIVKNGWYDAENLKNFNLNHNEKPFKLVCSKENPEYDKKTSDKYCNNYENEGAIEIKAAWMVAKDMKDEERNNYYITQRAIEVDTEDDKKDKIVDVALVGFHIFQKTSYAGWVISTFEHIRNAPDTDQNKTDGNYNLYNNFSEKVCGTEHTTEAKDYLWGLENTNPGQDKSPDNVTNTIYAMIKTDGKNVPRTPSQITRKNPIDAGVKKINEDWQKLLKDKQKNGGNTWLQFYQLIGSQWLRSPNAKNVNRNQNLANVAFEPFGQNFEKSQSCFSCHSRAKLPNSNVPADLSFMIRRAESSKNSNQP
ncbi:MAG: hypothetical protein F6K48_09825 [Okeania sp. SIO3H1]|nr:hypothetical protein [Okeania sp. SIO3H1]